VYRVIKSATGFAIFFLVAVGIGLAGGPKQESTKEPRPEQDDLATLRRDINALRAEQQQILSQLNELERHLQSITSGSPSRQIPPLALEGEPFRGDRAAVVAIIEYADFECEFCGKYEREVYPQIFEKYIQTGKVKYFYRDLPVAAHPNAVLAARASHCAAEQGKYWEMHDDLFAHQTALLEKNITERAQTLGLDSAKLAECLASARYTDLLLKRVSEAQSMGINGTPTFLLGTVEPNGNVVNASRGIVGAAPFESFNAILDALLSPKDQQAPPATKP
jgi:protein-disulfide isomerase